MTVSGTGVILNPGGGRSFPFGANTVTVKVGREDGGEVFSVIEIALAAGDPGPPPHIHRNGYETLYVLDGEIEMLAGDERVLGGPGSLLHVPPGVVHAFGNPTANPARALFLCSPAALLSMIEDFCAAFPPGGGPPDEAKLAAVFENHDIEIALPAG